MTITNCQYLVRVEGDVPEIIAGPFPLLVEEEFETALRDDLMSLYADEEDPAETELAAYYALVIDRDGAPSFEILTDDYVADIAVEALTATELGKLAEDADAAEVLEGLEQEK